MSCHSILTLGAPLGIGRGSKFSLDPSCLQPEPSHFPSPLWGDPGGPFQVGTSVVPCRALAWGWESKSTSAFLHFPFPGTETNSFHGGRSYGGTTRELTNPTLPFVRTVLGALDSLESFKVNKLAFLTKGRLSSGIYPHRVLQQHSYRQAPIGARSQFWAGKCSWLFPLPGKPWIRR